MVQESFWLLSPIVMAWLIQKLFNHVFHPALSEREIVTSEGKKEINPYFNLGYAATPYKKQKDTFLKVLYAVLFSAYAIIVLPILWIDNPVDQVFDPAFKFSAPPAFKFSALLLSALYTCDLVWNESEHNLLAFHHLATILAVFLVVLGSEVIPPGLFFIRVSWIPFHDAFPNIMSVLYRFNLVADHIFWQTLRMYHYIVASLIIFTIEWLFLIYASAEKNFVLIVCVIIWELTELWGMSRFRDFVKNLPQITKKKMEREVKFLTELDQVKKDPCGDKYLALDSCIANCR